MFEPLREVVWSKQRSSRMEVAVSVRLTARVIPGIRPSVLKNEQARDSAVTSIQLLQAEFRFLPGNARVLGYCEILFV